MWELCWQVNWDDQERKQVMAVNRDKPDRWKQDIAESVDMYNDWFMRFAPEVYRTTRVQTTKNVEATLKATKNLKDVGYR